MRSLRLAVLAVLLGAILWPATAFASRPANDDFANAIALPADASSYTATGTNVDATQEAGEPEEYGVSGAHSVWYSWTPASSGTAVFTTCDSGFDTVMAVYTGSTVSSLNQVAFSDNNALVGCGTYDGSSAVIFQGVAGTTYSIQIYGADNATGTFALHHNPEPPNDNFADAIGTNGGLTISGFNVSATKEAGEPDHAGSGGGASVWYRWTAPVTANVPITTCGSSFDTLLAVYTGTAVGSLTPVVSDDDSHICGAGSTQSAVTISAVKGTTYDIAVDGKDGATGAISLHIPPVNDDFAGALPVTSSVYGVNQNATAEPGEPDDEPGASGGESVWYTWTATFTGTANANVCLASSDTVLSVYTGSSIDALTPVASNDDSDTCGTGSTHSAVSFAATQGTVYDIEVDSKNAAGDFTLSLPPANDDFADAQTVTGLPVEATGRSVLATKEAGEPNHGGDPGGASIWYSWTAPSSGPVAISTCGSDFDTTLGVYTGSSVSALTTVAENDDSTFCGTGSDQSAVSFSAVAGTTYAIAVDGHGGASGDVRLNVGAPANDAFANAQPLPSNGGTVTGSTVGASRETGEPEHAQVTGSRSVWYSWTAPAGGRVSIDTCNSTFKTLLGVYTGTSVANLTQVAADEYSSFCGGGSTRSQVSFVATAETTYMIAVDTALEQPGSLTLTLAFTPFPANDAFADATSIPGTAATVTGSNVGATLESGEPENAGDAGGASIWYSWTAPASRQVIIDTCGSDFDTTLGVYTGAAVDSLTAVASDDDSSFCGTGSTASEVSFAAVAGTVYMLAVDGHGGATGDLVLNVGAPVNDDFAAATPIPGAVATVTGTNVAASKEIGEPDHAGNAGGASVWYSWTPSLSGPVTIDTCGSDFNTLLGVYTGTGLTSLTPVVSDDDSGACGAGSTQSSASFTATAGTVYRIAVDGLNGATGAINLEVAGDAVTPETTITSAPTGTITDATPTLNFTANVANSTFACSVDSGPFSSCTSPFTTPALADGPHTVTVVATDPYGNVSAPASANFTVDTSNGGGTTTTTTAPVTTTTTTTPGTTTTATTPMTTTTTPGTATTTGTTTTTATPAGTGTAEFTIRSVKQRASRVIVVIVPGTAGKAVVTVTVPAVSLVKNPKGCRAAAKIAGAGCPKLVTVIGAAHGSDRAGVPLTLRLGLKHAAKVALSRGVKLQATVTVVYRLANGISATKTVRLTLT